MVVVGMEVMLVGDIAVWVVDNTLSYYYSNTSTLECLEYCMH